MEFENEVLISYSSDDRPWNREIHERLEADAFSNFWDETAIPDGDDVSTFFGATTTRLPVARLLRMGP